MNYELKDVMNTYPYLSTRLVRTSPQMYDVSLQGSCNLLLSKKELKSILDINLTSKKAVFTLYETGEGEGPGVYFDAVVFMSMANGDVIYTWHYDAGASVTEEHGDYQVLRMDSFTATDHVITDKDYIRSVIDFDHGVELHTLDVRSIFRLLNKRTSCVNKFKNYTVNKTREVFNKVIKRFNIYNTIVILNLYLMINCIVLDIDIAKEFINQQKVIDNQDENYDYDEYIENTEQYRLMMIDDINRAIDGFY